MTFSENTKTFFQSHLTPFYFYDIDLLKLTLQSAKSEIVKYENFHIHYAMKANVNKKILQYVNNYGFGADCVSGNEIIAALEAGIAAEKIVFAGVGKTDSEILVALENNIFCFNVESAQELEVINSLASGLNKTAKIALRLNPNINALTHKYITTGTFDTKFGINNNELQLIFEKLTDLKNVEIIGLHFHIGSQITDLSVFEELTFAINNSVSHFEQLGFNLQHINVGGGLGIDYQNPNEIPPFQQYFRIFAEKLQIRPAQQVHFELGRSLVAQCGTLLTKVLYTKQGFKNQFVVVDAGFTELLRPALYNAFHYIENISSNKKIVEYDVVGPICESSDVFGRNIPLNCTERGNLLAIRSVGAYGEVMSSRYNLRTPAIAYYSDEL